MNLPPSCGHPSEIFYLKDYIYNSSERVFDFSLEDESTWPPPMGAAVPAPHLKGAAINATAKYKLNILVEYRPW
jgi:hypothetical protein